jgi:hypothetical protein
VLFGLALLLSPKSGWLGRRRRQHAILPVAPPTA